MNQQQKDSVILNYAAEKLFRSLYNSVNITAKIGIDFKSDIPAEALKGLSDEKKDVYTAVYGRKETQVNEMNIIFDFLRKIICNTEMEFSKENAEMFKNISAILNKKIFLSYVINSDKTITLYAYQKHPGNVYLRSIVEAIIEYINTLQTVSDNMKQSAPVNVCPLCDGIFMKKRTDQTYCSKYCKSASWANEKGKEYFAEKARNNRAIKNRHSNQ